MSDDRHLPLPSAARPAPSASGRGTPGTESDVDSTRGVLAFRIFAVAWVFFGLTAFLGLLLRMQFIFPLPGFNYGNWLHTHSHLAFLGWIYNAFFALAVRFFVPAGSMRGYWRLFLVTQVAVVGVLLTFPVQGYARESIIFSSLHMICAAVFVCKLLRVNRAAPAARLYLRAAGIFMLASAMGPLTIAPLTVAGLAGTAWADLAIGYYLHFQYNGWFIFFLLAVVYQAMHEHQAPSFETPARRAFGWLLAGGVLTLSLSALPMNPPLWVFLLAAAGGIAQAAGGFHLLRSFKGTWHLFVSRHARMVRWLALCALSLLILKFGLQGLAAWPGLLNLATNHFTIIVFMHLVFLGVVSPMLIAWGIELGWVRFGRLGAAGLGLFATGAFVSQSALGYMPLAGWFGWASWPSFHATQFAGALLMFAGVLLIGFGLRRPGKAGESGSA